MSTDKNNIDELIQNFDTLSTHLSPADYYGKKHPLDDEIRRLISQIVLNDEEDNEFKIYIYKPIIRKLWLKLLQKSIICLRYFDTREPFISDLNENKQPYAYGINKISEYFDQYIDFEKTLYGSVNYYRDHFLHVFRVWILGINLLLKNDAVYLKQIKIAEEFVFSDYEKISIWTIIALTHDLGYPLEKSHQVIEKTRNMMKAFVTNPQILMDVSFSGVQNSMNDFILRFISSKMWEIDREQRTIKEKTKDDLRTELDRRKAKSQDDLKNYLKTLRYVARLQPKYYFKFQKSLEHNQHGILSVLVIYKLLLYFLESDYSLNEDYMFNYEDARQFYIRREILRSISSHTCKDVYQNDALSFAFLLIVCDDAQEWGRKSINQLYVNKSIKYNFMAVKINTKEPNEHNVISADIDIQDKHEIAKKNDNDNIKLLLDLFRDQCIDYRNWFRDGQDTSNRNFDFRRTLYLSINNSGDMVLYRLNLEILRDDRTKIIAKRTDDNPFDVNDILKTCINDSFKNDGGCTLDSDNKIITVYIN